MKHSKLTLVMTVVLSIVMVLSSFSTVVSAAAGNVIFDGTTFGTNGYYNVISKKDYVLVPGAAIETEMVINNDAGDRRQVMHIVEVDPSNPDISIIPGYYGIDKDLSKVENHSAMKLTDTAKYYEDVLGYNVVAGMNTALAYDCNAPFSYLVYNGKVLVDHNNKINDFHSGVCATLLCVYKNEDGTCYCELRTASQGLRGDEWQAIGANFSMTVNNGTLVSKTEERTSAAAARSMIGVKEDGTLVLVMNDGRGANNSVGFNNYELGESMLALGCKWAFNCDGGGSSTFVSKRAGEDEFTMRSVPCDGAERPTLNGIFIVSNVGPTGELGKVEIVSAYDYFAPSSTYTFVPEAIDTNGYAMEMPNDISWRLSDDSFGTVTNGVFVSNGKTGKVDIEVVSGGVVIGSKSIQISNPTVLKFAEDKTSIPYSTADGLREITLPIVAQIGEANVYYDITCFEFALSEPNAGYLDGFKFIATDDISIAGTRIDATYIATGKTISYTIEFGKGSEVIFDFEDGDISEWMGFDEAKQWNIDNGVENTLTSSEPIGGQFSSPVDGNTFLASIDNGGQVRNGNYALGWNVDNTTADFAQWTYNILYRVGEPIVLRDVANEKNATAFGMWVYIPEGAAGLAMQLTVYAGESADNLLPGTQLHFYFTANDGSRKTLNSCSEADIPESRWVYASCDLTGYKYVSLVNPRGSIYREPTFIRTYAKPISPAVHTFYFDDFTLDYSSAVDDRVLPTISNPAYAISDTDISLENGAILSNSTVVFSANVYDNEELDSSTAAIYVDGKYISTSVSGNHMFSESVTLLSGDHVVSYNIKDKLGNLAKITRTFTVSGEAVVSLEGHNDSGRPAEYDSIYYIDITVADIKSINNIFATLKLQNANKWELDGVSVAEGFSAYFDYNEVSGLLDVSVEKNRETYLDGKQVIVSIPVRVWSWDAIDHVTGKVITSESQFASGNCPIVSIDCSVISGFVDLDKGVHGTFGGKVSVETNLNDNINLWHYHDTELPVLNKEATCTEDGYTGRTYCETCGSVIEWGTSIKAYGHNYELVDDKFVCTNCGNVYNSGTGLFTLNGKTYYTINGKLATGWQQIESDQYYFDKNTYEGINGEYSSYEICSTSQSFTMSFTDGKLDSGVWVSMDGGTRYYYGATYYHNTTVVIDGDTYSFNNQGYRYEGICVIKWNPYSNYQLFEYTPDGKYVGELYVDGIYTTSNGDIYYLNGGIAYSPGLVYENGDYYYFAANKITAIRGCTYYVSNTNNLLPAGYYTFDGDGKIIIDLQGLVKDADGKIRYYVDGVATYAGLVQDEDGAYYYISGDGLAAITDTERYITKTNGLLPEGTY
ncbi:MAG: hypothetical protein HFE63_01265, partial [Clostridiales bacterium]|nr:hypothetical protein [Clostridiales bacterium]